MFAHGCEVHAALNKVRHGCERRRDVRRPCPVSAQCLENFCAPVSLTVDVSTTCRRRRG